MNNIMLDLETLGTKPGCIILSIGAVFFGKDGLGKEFYRVISTPKSEKIGLGTDRDTVEWWNRQSEEARTVIAAANNSDAVSPIVAAAEFSDFVEAYEDKNLVQVWGNGSDFDQPILAELYYRVGVPLPWKFWNNRCYRTLKYINPSEKLVRVGTYHNALDDAKSQAEHAVRILNKIVK